MKKLALFVPILMFGCSTSSKVNVKESEQLYEVISQQSQGGASIQFYEILTEEKEIAMLQKDEQLRHKISADDLKKSTFVILNMGEKPTGGYSINVKEAIEDDTKITLILKETSPAPGAMVTQVLTYPFAVVKVNSRKIIEIR